MRKALVALAALACVALGSAASADEGWLIERFHSEIVVRPDASIRVVETIDVDFGPLEKHGIFREIPVRYRYDDERDRVYELRAVSITDATGKPWPYERSERGANVAFKIGDPDRTISGRHTYRIAYEVRGALNAFADHDELFWNVNGEWPVRSARVEASARLERGTLGRTTCFQGGAGSASECAKTVAEGGRALFSATRPLGEDEQLTIVVSFPKGAVNEPVPILVRAVRGPEDWFRVSAGTLGGAVGTFALGTAGILAWWMRAGRDRRFLKRYYLDPTTEERQGGLFEGDTIVAEYEPPELLRPAEVGLVLDERADTKDLTATIVQLAVRGHLVIEEIPAQGLFGKKDWILRKRSAPKDELAPYERRILDGLFDDGDEAKLSELKGTFHSTLWEAQKELYRSAVERRWFPADPFWTRVRWQVAGFVTALMGGFATIALGALLGWGLIGIGLVLVGLAMFPAAGAMPSRSAHGRELLLRILGFKRYMDTAETERQRFAERENIFAAYLPYAIVFGSVTKWARAFSGIDAQRATAGWYVGPAVTDLGAFSSDLAGFTSTVSSAISSTPASSGSSGFSGGSAGGGGGGGGGGSW